jgi:hypothetical protein
MVHPALPWVKIQSTAVEKDRLFEVLEFAIATGSSLNRNDLAVDAFGHAVGDPMGAVGHDIIDPFLESLCEFLQRFHGDLNDSSVSVIEESVRMAFGLLSPKISKQLLVRPGPTSREGIVAQGLKQCLLFLAVVLQGGKPKVFATDKSIIPLANQSSMLPFSNLV